MKVAVLVAYRDFLCGRTLQELHPFIQDRSLLIFDPGTLNQPTKFEGIFSQKLKHLRDEGLVNFLSIHVGSANIDRKVMRSVESAVQEHLREEGIPAASRLPFPLAT